MVIELFKDGDSLSDNLDISFVLAIDVEAHNLFSWDSDFNVEIVILFFNHHINNKRQKV